MNRMAVETSLAHSVGNATESSYLELSDIRAARQTVMDKWSEFHHPRHRPSATLRRYQRHLPPCLGTAREGGRQGEEAAGRMSSRLRKGASGATESEAAIILKRLNVDKDDVDFARAFARVADASSGDIIDWMVTAMGF